jgi:formate transporter
MKISMSVLFTRIAGLLPPEVARRAEQAGAVKASLDAISVFIPAMLAGAFISLGGILSTTIAAGADVTYGILRLLTGLTFWLSLILVVVTGVELFMSKPLIYRIWPPRDSSPV